MQSPSSETLIEAVGLSRRFGANQAVSGLNLTLKKGEVLGLLGPNGAGKSTSMKMLTGNLSPSEGAVRICGQDVAEQPQAAKKHLGYLPEQPPVYPELDVDEYLMFCAGLHGVARAHRPAAVEAAKRSCGLSQVGRRLIGNLSKGYQQRVGLAQAIVHRPDVIILDEPTVGLDPIQIREIRALIAELGREHSVILSSHILPEIQAVCSRVMIIHRGRSVYDAAIDAHEGKASLAIQLLRPPAVGALQALAGVAAVTPLDDGRYRLDLQPAVDPREALVAAAVAGNWGLVELHRESKTLEEIFVEKTSGEVVVESYEGMAA
jgi:ABC-2 type transport system ATP-binding protein